MLELGLVGKPNTGKTTFFNAATRAEAPMGGYPFTTIDANIGVTYVRNDCPCQELEIECDPKNSRCVNGVRYVPVRIIDVAGLVEGAYEGRGLGNQFLDNLRMASALIHMIDAAGATDSEGEPVSPGTHDPVKDVKFLEDEIDRWLEDILSENWDDFIRSARLDSEDPLDLITDKLSGLGIKRTDIRKSMRSIDSNKSSLSEWDDEERFNFVKELRKTSKPLMIGANKIDLENGKQNIDRLKDLDYPVVPMCCEAELALRRAEEKNIISYNPGDSEFEIIDDKALNSEQKKALSSVRKILNNWGSTGVQNAIDKAIYDLLEMIVVYPVDDENKFTDGQGNVLPDSILVPKGTTAKEFAYEIHSDLGDSFIHAIDAKSNRRIGEDYKVKNGDIIRVVSGADK